MPASNFMLGDLAGVAAAFCIFALFAFIPGYALGWVLNLLDFRRRGALAQAALGVSLSIAICPVIAYLAGRFAPARAVWLVFAPCWAGFALLLAARWRRMIPRGYRLAKALAVAWLALGTASMIDLQWGSRLYYSVISFDYTLRVAITSAITRAGVPPPNPYFFPGQPAPLRYHYFWMVLCSLAQRTGGNLLSARFAAFGGTLWCGLGLIAVLALYLRFAAPEGPVRLQRRLGIAIALLGVTGLDLIPTLLLKRNGVLLPDMEWWNEQVTSWVGTMLWVPHNLAALVACLTGFLLLWSAPARKRDAIVAAVVAGLSFATAFGCSVYVAFTFFAFLGVWGLITVVRKWRRDTALLALSGCCAAAPVLSHIQGLRGQASGGSFLAPAIRTFKIVEMALASQHVSAWKISLANILLLPLNYLLELGFFLLIGVLALKRLRAARAWSRWDLAACAMAGTSIAICTFLRSGVIGNNDLGYRGFLPAQFILLLWAVSLEGKPELNRGALRGWLAFLLFAGAAGTAYEVCLLRGFTVFSDFAPGARYAWMDTAGQFGKRTYAARQVYERLRETLPVTTVMQHNPDTDPGFIPHGLYADRQLAVETRGCGTAFGGDERLCAGAYATLYGLFNSPAADRDVDAACNQFGIGVLVARDADPAWADPRSWIWSRTPLAANSLVRALPCGKGVMP